VQCTKTAETDDFFQPIQDRKDRRPMQLALFQPDIPQNTGTILRLCA
jgi:tRNA (cytidine/uridine-2'-O-)-methyltransferase